MLEEKSPVERGERGLLLAQAIGMPKEFLIVHPEARVPNRMAEKFRRLRSRRAKHEPMAYILGEKEFFGRLFFVSKDVLIPRPETELLIETVLGSRLRGNDAILDIGCGSGAIGLTLAAELPKALVVCADVSAKALAVTRKNAKRLGVVKRIVFKRLDVLKKGSLGGVYTGEGRGRDDKNLVVVANLPYLPERTWKNAAQSIRRYEPKIALTSGRDGLDHYRALMTRLVEMKTPPKLLLLEAEPAQMPELERLVGRTLPDHDVMIIRDLFGDDRVLAARRA